MSNPIIEESETIMVIEEFIQLYIQSGLLYKIITAFI